MTADYHRHLDTIIASSQWMRVLDDQSINNLRKTEYKYDNFGRLVAVARPGDSLDMPTEEYEYSLENPVSRIVKRTRSKSSQSPDLESIQCFDGLGRQLQSYSASQPLKATSSL